jgi:hypothetical protein
MDLAQGRTRLLSPICDILGESSKNALPKRMYVQIAKDYTNVDVVVSQDSDMIGHFTVATLWRPISRGPLLVYNMSDICTLLEITREQLTALAVVSSNDYNRNISSFGPETNYSAIKKIKLNGNNQVEAWVGLQGRRSDLHFH